LNKAAQQHRQDLNPMINYLSKRCRSKKLDQVVESILINRSSSDLLVKVERNGTLLDVSIPHKLLNENASKGFIFIPVQLKFLLIK